MESKSKQFKLSALVSSTMLALAAIVGVVSDLWNLAGKIHFLSLIIALWAGAGTIACIVMWWTYSGAIRELAEGEAGEIALGVSRIDMKKRMMEMIHKKGISGIDIGGLALRSTFFHRHSEFSEWLLAYLREHKEVKVRVWLLDPDSIAVGMREMAERERTGVHLQVECRESLETLKDIVLVLWKEQRTRRPEVLLVGDIAINHFIFRVDEEMIVAPYLQHSTGNASPAFHLREGNRWFKVYKQQFDLCFGLHTGNLYPPPEELK